MDTTDLSVITDLLAGLDEASGYEVISSWGTGLMEPGRRYLVVYYEDARWLYLETWEPDPSFPSEVRAHHRTHSPTATSKIRTATQARGELTREELHRRARLFAAHVAGGGTHYPVAPAEMLLAKAGVPAYR